MMASLLHARRITPLLGYLLVAVVFAIDTLTTVGGAIAVLYVLALLLVAPSLGIRRLVAVAVLCLVLTLTSFLIAHSDEWAGDAIMRCAIAILAIAAATLLLIRAKKDSQALAKQAALLDLSHEAIFVRRGGRAGRRRTAGNGILRAAIKPRRRCGRERALGG